MSRTGIDVSRQMKRGAMNLERPIFSSRMRPIQPFVRHRYGGLCCNFLRTCFSGEEENIFDGF